MIVAYLGKNISEYIKKVLTILCSNVPCCPVCGHIMEYHSSYLRHVHIGILVEWINIYRFKCIVCNKTHAILPDFISPRKHYSAPDIELTLRDVEDGIKIDEIEVGPSISTMKRWVMEFKDKVNQAAGALKSMLYTYFNKVIGEITLFKLQSFELLSRILLEFPKIECSDIMIGEANIWLLRNEAGIYI
jgi:transposase-like protein